MLAVSTRRKNWLTLGVVIVSQLILLGAQATGRNNVRLLRLWANVLIVPAEQATNALARSGGNLWRHYIALHDAAEQDQQLRGQIQSLTLEKNRLEGEVEAIRRLQALLSLKEEVPSATVAAQVIGSSPSEAFKSIIINKGSSAGLTNNLPVITPDGVVGRTVRVYVRSAVVQLITDSESGVGIIFDQSRVHGVAKGTGGTLLGVDYVVNEEEIAAGDWIRTSGEDQIYPKGLLVGRVVSVESGAGIFKKIMARPAARLSRLEEVLVMKKSSPRD